MTVYDVSLPDEFEPDAVQRLVKETARSFGLNCRLETEMKQYPGSKHWHFARSGEKGTLEVTLLAKQRKFHISFHSNRNADWLPEACERLKTSLENSLKK